MSKRKKFNKHFHTLKIAVLILAVLYLFIVIHPNIVFANPGFNALANAGAFIMIAFALPISLFVLDDHKLSIFSLLVVLPVSLFFLVIAGIVFISSSYPVEEVINKVHTNDYEIRAIRTNGGITTDFGIIIEQRWVIVPGLIYRKTLYNKYHCRSAALAVLGANQISFTPCSAEGKTKIVDLARF